MGYGGWEEDTRGRGYGDICIHIADSLCYTAATNTTMQSNYTPIKMLKKKKLQTWDFPGGPVVKNPPSNAGDTGSPGGGTKIPHATTKTRGSQNK